MAVEARTISTVSVSAQEDEKVWQSFTTVSSEGVSFQTDKRVSFIIKDDLVAHTPLLVMDFKAKASKITR